MGNKKILKRKLRHKRVRAKISGTQKKPRLSVYRSLKYIYAQLIDDENGKTLVSFSSFSKQGKISSSEVGRKIAKKALELKIDKVVFDRGGFKYHGRIKELALGAKKEGLKF